MHDTTKTLLSRIKVGDVILAGLETSGPVSYARPKSTIAKLNTVTAIDYSPDQWSGKVYTLTLDDGRKTEPRYGTTHVYVEVKPEADPHEPDADVKALADAITADPRIPGKARAVKIPTQKFAPEVQLDLAVSGTRRVQVAKDGTMTVQDWTGGDVTERTPKGRLVHITADGVLTILEDFPEDDEGMSEAEAQEVLNSDRCGQCKGFGVVRKRGSQAGKNYRTLNGAEAATTNGNSVTCPACKGAALILRTA